MKRLILVLTVAALVGAACGGDGDATTTEAPEEPTAHPCVISNVHVDLVTDLMEIALATGAIAVPAIVSEIDLLLGGSGSVDPDEGGVGPLYGIEDVTTRWLVHAEGVTLRALIPQGVRVVDDDDLLSRLPVGASAGSAFQDAAERIVAAHDYLDVAGTPQDSFADIAKLRVSIPEAMARLLTELTVEEILGLEEIRDIDPTDLASSILFSPDDDAPLEFDAVIVRPVYGMTYEGHWGWEPGPEPIQPWAESIPQGTLLEALRIAAPTTGMRIAVVDSGFPSHPDWPGLDAALGPDTGDLVVAEGPDAVDDVPSHGSFVVSLLRQLSPKAHIIGAKAHLVSGEHVSSDGEIVPSSMVDEISIELAINRLAAALDDQQPVSLNLSFGTYVCPAGIPVPLPSIVGDAVAMWQSDASGMKIYAAAGNESLTSDDHPESEFYPASEDGIVGVAALDPSGAVVTWESPQERVTMSSTEDALTRRWVDDFALGTDLIGVTNGQVSLWSGSSFATAVASALSARANGSEGQSDVFVLLSKGCPNGLMYSERDLQDTPTRKVCVAISANLPGSP